MHGANFSRFLFVPPYESVFKYTILRGRKSKKMTFSVPSCDVDVFELRESLHEAKGHRNRILERNYRITGNIKGKKIIIVDDVLTTGQSVADYKEEIERCGGKVVVAIFYGKTITLPYPLIVRLEVWWDYITTFAKSN